MNDVALNWQNNSAAIGGGQPLPAPFFNSNCFADPGDQNPGNAPRYFSGLRVDGIHNMDVNLYKSFVQPASGVPAAGVVDSAFGAISGDAGGETPRYFQFGLRFEF